MVAAVPYHPPPRRQFRWSNIATRQLIQERREANDQFNQLGNRHMPLWDTIAQNIFAATGFVCTGYQCNSKWHALKSGYENLARIMRNNP